MLFAAVAMCCLGQPFAGETKPAVQRKDHQKAAAPADTLKLLTAELAKSPGDRQLREKIVTLAAGMKPMPAIPTAAKRPFYKAATFFKEAKDTSAYMLAIKSYEEALLIAPWWPEAYYNLGQAREAAGLYADAAESIKLYLLTRPGEEEAGEAEKKLYALEAKMELAQQNAKKKAAEAAVEAEASVKKPFAGDWCQATEAAPNDCYYDEYRRMRITGNESSGYSISFACKQAGCIQPGYVDSVSVSGQTISFRVGERYNLPMYGEDGGVTNVHNKVSLKLSTDENRLAGSQEAYHIGDNEWLRRGGELWARVK